jgi:tRNA nucleotidyltransferase/poly(A) polymerase
MGKFATWTIEPDGRHRFIGHDEVGSKLALRLLKSLKFSNKQIEYIRYIIKKHMYPTAVVSSPELTEKVMMRYVRKSQDNAIDNILIAQADRLSARGPQITEEDVNQNITALNRLLNFYLEIKETLIPLPKLIDGNDIMEILGIEPSKRLGEILSALNEAQVSGEVVSKEDAVNFVKNYPKD